MSFADFSCLSAGDRRPESSYQRSSSKSCVNWEEACQGSSWMDQHSQKCHQDHQAKQADPKGKGRNLTSVHREVAIDVAYQIEIIGIIICEKIRLRSRCNLASWYCQPFSFQTNDTAAQSLVRSSNSRLRLTWAQWPQWVICKLRVSNQQEGQSRKRSRSICEDYFYPEENMPCVLDSPFCSYDQCSLDEEDANKSRRKSNSQASTSGFASSGSWSSPLFH